MNTTATSVESLQQGQGSVFSGITESGDVSRNDFLKLLVAQLQNQDPMNPTENQEFVAELATFSSLEQQENQTALLKQLVAAEAGSANGQALSMIGNEVLAEVSEFYYQEGQPIDFSYLANAGQAVINIMTPSGRTVATQTMDLASSGRHDYTFVGVGENGQALQSGKYVIQISSAVTESGESAGYPSFLRGAVDSVDFVEGIPMLNVGGQIVDMSQIYSVLRPRTDELNS